MSQEKKQKAEFCMDHCPMKYAMDRLGGKWKIPIICALWFEGSLRYSELKNSIKGISNTMLASSLKELEQDGLITRTQYPEIPVRVEYSVTETCRKIVPAIQILRDWGRDLILSQMEQH